MGAEHFVGEPVELTPENDRSQSTCGCAERRVHAVFLRVEHAHGRHPKAQKKEAMSIVMLCVDHLS